MDEIKYIVFSGGGAKGVAFCGTLLVLDECFRSGSLQYNHMLGCAGTSIGSLFAFLCVTRTPCSDILRSIFDEHALDELEPSPDIRRLWGDFGLDNGEKLEYMVKQVISLAFPSCDDVDSITLDSLFSITSKEFVCCTANVSTGEMVHLEHIDHPDVPVWKAIVASMSVPILFTPIEYKGHLYVDGAMLSNVPFSVFPIEKSLVFRLVSGFPVKDKSSLFSSGFSLYLQRLLDSALRWNENQFMKSAIIMKNRTNIIDIKSTLPTLAFTISRKNQMDAILKGVLCTFNGLCALELTQREAKNTLGVSS